MSKRTSPFTQYSYQRTMELTSYLTITAGRTLSISDAIFSRHTAWKPFVYASTNIVEALQKLGSLSNTLKALLYLTRRALQALSDIIYIIDDLGDPWFAI